MKVVVLGVSGMLGSTILDFLSRDTSLNLIATVRSKEFFNSIRPAASNIKWQVLDIERCNNQEIYDLLDDTQWVINAIGMIKPYIHDDNQTEIQRAIMVNSIFPHRLAQAAEQQSCRVLQIATDCVFSGNKGLYLENDCHDALDVYGKTKSLGEVFSANLFNLRCSIIGPEIKSHTSLMDWFLKQPKNSNVNGYTNHEWNGVTTLHFAKICNGIMRNEISFPHIHHLIPADKVSKVDLLRTLAQEYHREDISIVPMEAKTAVDRTLSTLDITLNNAIWKAAGYNKAPSIGQMIAELAEYNR